MVDNSAAAKEALVTEFYTAFAAQDAERMARTYHSQVVFCDPAFGVLKKEHVGNMWRMLLEPNKEGIKPDLSVEFSNVTASEGEGATAHWEAKYVVGGNKVLNKIDAAMEFAEENGELKIVKHTDVFNFWTWAKQALGVAGWLLGWSSFFQGKVSSTVNARLAKFEKRRAE